MMIPRPSHLRVFEELIKFTEVLCHCDKPALGSKHHDVEFLVRMIIDYIRVVATQISNRSTTRQPDSLDECALELYNFIEISLRKDSYLSLW